MGISNLPPLFGQNIHFPYFCRTALPRTNKNAASFAALGIIVGLWHCGALHCGVGLYCDKLPKKPFNKVHCGELSPPLTLIVIEFVTSAIAQNTMSCVSSSTRRAVVNCCIKNVHCPSLKRNMLFGHCPFGHNIDNPTGRWICFYGLRGAFTSSGEAVALAREA